LELIARTARLVPYPKRPRYAPSIATAYRYEPLPGDHGSELGNLYIVLEALVSGRAGEEIADLIIETAGEHYYNKPGSDESPLTRFEHAIKAVNHELAELVNKGSAAWIGKLSAAIAIQVGHELHVAQTGSTEVYLYRGQSVVKVASGSSSDKPASASKTFGFVASGDLEPGDRILMATPALTHQLPLPRINSIVASGSPNSSISELTELLKKTPAERIAALIIEVLTPEHAALQVMPEEPNEAHIGEPANAIESAKQVAAPIAVATLESSKKLGRAAISGLNYGQTAAHSFAKPGKRMLTNPKVILALALILIIGSLGGLMYHNHQVSLKHDDDLLSRYDSYYQTYSSINSDGNKAQAASQLITLQATVTDLSKTKDGSRTNQLLTTARLTNGEPNSLKGLGQLIAAKLDLVNGLTRVNGTTIATISQGQPAQFEIAGGNAYVFTRQTPALAIINIAAKSSQISKAKVGQIGTIVSTSLSAAGTGIYLLTDKPAVWFYRFDNDSLTEQTINLGDWPAEATAIASYSNNLYILAASTVYKFTPTISGFTPGATYLSAKVTGLADSTAMALDGTFYILSASGLHQYTAGKLTQTVSVPSEFSKAALLRASKDSNLLLAVSAANQRIGVWDDASKLIYKQQYALNNIHTLASANFDAKTGHIYALADNKLIEIK